MAGRLANLSETLDGIDWEICEVLLIHDIGDDLTGIELRNIKSDYNQTQLFIHEGKWANPGDARNAGLDKAIGNWIIFWDSDDVGYAKNVLQAIEESNNSDIVFGRYTIADASTGVITNDVLPSQITDIAFSPGLWRTSFRREKIQGVRFSSYKMGEDQVFLAKCLSLGLSYQFRDVVFYKYFRSVPNQLTSNPIAISQLRFASVDIAKMLKKSSDELSEFLLVMLIKQSITGLRKNFQHGIVPNLKLLFRTFIRRPFQFIRALLRIFVLQLNFNPAPKEDL